MHSGFLRDGQGHSPLVKGDGAAFFVFAGGYFKKAPADNLVGVKAEHLFRGMVNHHYPAFLIYRDQGVADAGEQELIFGLFFAYFGVGALQHFLGPEAVFQHPVKGLGQLSELIPGPNVYPGVGLAFAYPFGNQGDFFDGPGDGLGDEKGNQGSQE